MGSSRDTRSLAAGLVVSIIVHTIALSLPGRRAIEIKPPEILQVRIERVEPPKVIPPAPEARPAPVSAPKPVPKKQKEVQQVQRTPLPEPLPSQQQTPPSAVPREMPPPPAILALPQAETPVRTSPATEGETSAPRQEGPRVAVAAPKGDAAPREQSLPVTPPNSSAAYLRNPPPRYPVSARRNGEQGTVTLSVFVTREGAPARVSIHTTSGSPSLDQAALEAVKTWRFVPARRGSEPVDAPVLVPIVFKLDGLS